jgi:hemolysin activation/secretion protein
MRGLKPVLCFAIFLLTSSYQSTIFAQPAASQTAGGISQQEKSIEKQRDLQQQAGQERSAEKQAVPQEVVLPDSGPKVLVNKIDVQGATLLSAKEIQTIVSSFEGKQLSLKDFQKIADLISGEYRKKGYMTSRAYVPPQSVKEGVLVIKVIEGKLGTVDIKGNKYFSTALLKKKLNMEQGGYFDYSALQNSLVYINEHPDRSAKAVLVPGAERGTTDVMLEVKDRLPVHVGFGYDNFGSRYIDKNRYYMGLEHNNLTGHDDKLFLKYMTSESSYMRLQQGRYSYSVTPTLDLGVYMIMSKIKLGREYEDLDSRGKARIYGLFLNKVLVQKPELDVRFNAGFDYKSVVNFLSGNKDSRDELRILKGGFDFDFSDKLGRNIINTELDYGVPDILGAMEDKDPMSSRKPSSGAEFQKGMVNYFRLQPLFLSTHLLWKNFAQYTNQSLAASEQFQIGGAVSVRGYPPAERSGDKGFFTSLEWTLPVFGLPKDIKVPFRKESLYDAWKLVTFWDWGYVNLKNPSAGEKKDETLKGWGFGTHFAVQNLLVSVEVGYPIGKKTPSDGRHAHPWVECAYKF